MVKKCLIMLGATLAGLLGASERAHAACTDSTETYVQTVTRTFDAGSSWSIDIYHRACEGLTIGGATYTPFGGSPTLILHRGTIAEVHVPYHSGTPRFLDVTTDTNGLGTDALVLDVAECPGGTLLDGDRICVRDEIEPFAYKMEGSFRPEQKLEIYMSSQLGNYNYINHWTFHDGGLIEPQVGLTGRLQEMRSSLSSPGNYRPYGSRLNQESATEVLIGKSHMHNFYYRLDFDIGGGTGDAINRMQFNPSTTASPESSCATPGQCGTNTSTQILNEAVQSWTAASFTSWNIFDKTLLNADGRRIGVELKPHVTGTWRGMTTTTEPWTNGELWVTRYDPCERYAARNLGTRLGTGCTAAAQNVSTMVNANTSVDGQDLVVWYVQRVHHVPRDEDGDGVSQNMPIEWTGFEIEPRNLFDRPPTF